jgi:hypothetical protein
MNVKTPTLTPAEALMTVAVLAMDSDDSYSLVEMQRLRAMAWLHPLFQDIDSVEQFVGRRFADLRARGRTALLEEARAALSMPLRETAYAWAAELVYSDGAVVPKEYVFLDKLANCFEVPGPLARKIQVVTAIRRRTS